MKKNILIILLAVSFLAFSCKSRRYINKIPYKILYDQKEIEKTLGINERTLPILDTLSQDENKLTDRQIYLKEKYAIILNVMPGEIKKYNFYDFIDQWVGTSYFNGFSQPTMAPFVSRLYSYAFKRNLPKIPLDIFKSKDLSLFTSRDFLQEGDIVFFRYSKDEPVGDVGVYLQNNRILVADQTNGLIISDFNLPYFQLRYVCAGRLILKENTTSNDDNDNGAN